MAIGFNRISYVSRSTGRSAVQAYAYISGTRGIDARTNQIADYRNKANGVSCADILAPEGAPLWASTSEIWNRLEAFVDATIEARYLLPETIVHFKNTARVAQTHIFALPIELDCSDWEEISRTFIAENFTARNLVAGFAIHADDSNPHLHVCVSLHALSGDTFSEVKLREMYHNNFRKEVFSNFALLFNARLLERGFNVQIDPRSYAERGLDLLPHVHEGWHARDLAEQGKLSTLVMENEQIRAKNAQIILRDTTLILKELSQTHATFSEEQALKCVQKRMNDDPTLSAFVFESVLKQAHFVGYDIEENKRYATPAYKQIEERALVDSKHLLSSVHGLSINPESIEAAIKRVNQSKAYHLSAEQEQAVYNACNSKRLALLVGRAGTGKTSSLQAIVALHKQAGFNVIGMALSAEAARQLGQDADIESKTIASLEINWKKQQEHEEALSNASLSLFARAEHQRKLDHLRRYDVQENTLFIADESGMIGTASMQRILNKALSKNAKVLLVGDDRQFKAIDAGDIFRKQVELGKQYDGYSELTRIVRQKHDWMVLASTALSESNPRHALDLYAEKGHLHALESDASVVSRIAERYVNLVVKQNNPSGLVITFTNEACAKLNDEIRSLLQINRVVDSIDHQMNGKMYAVNDQIIFLKNSSSRALSLRALTPSPLAALFSDLPQSITNGTKGVIQSITPLWDRETGELMDHRLVVHLEKDGTTYEASFNARDYSHFDHSYAITLYKSQGQTVNWTMVYATPHMDATAAYVAMTRHEQALEIYYSQTDFPTYQSLGLRLSHVQTKDLVVDYTRDPKIRQIYETVQSYVVLGREMAYLLRMGDGALYEAHKLERRVLAKEILENFSDHGGFILQQGLTKGHLEITAGLQARALSPLEERVLISLEQYMDAATSCRNLWNTIKATHPGVYAKTHPRYAEFKAGQDERGSLAHSLLSYAPIVRNFGKELYMGTGYGFATIQKQGAAFEEQMLERSALDRLSPDEQRDVALYKAMVVHQHFATQLYKEQRAKNAPLREGVAESGKNKQLLLFKTLVTDVEKQERLKIEACAGALASLVLDKITHFETLAAKLNLTINHSTLTMNARGYERQRLIYVAMGSEMPFSHEVAELRRQLGTPIATPLYEARCCRLSQMTASRELVAQIDADAAVNRKAVTKAVILAEVGLKGLNQIYNLARHAKRLEVNVAFGKETLKGEVYGLIEYSDACAKANQHWHRVQVEATQKACTFNKTSSYADFEMAAAKRDCLAYQMSITGLFSSQNAAYHNPVARLRQANALLMGETVGVSLIHFDKHIQSGFLHQACFTITDPQTPITVKQDAMDTLFTSLALDDQRAGTARIMDVHKITRMSLTERALKQIGETMPLHQDALNTYQQALLAYKKSFRDFITVHGTDFKLLDQDSPEAFNVKKAEIVRDKAAFHLRPLLTDNLPHTLMADLLTHLKVTQSQLLYQGDRFESLTWVRTFKESWITPGVETKSLLENQHTDQHGHTNPNANHANTDHDKANRANVAYQLLERFALEGATKTPSSVIYALKQEGVTLKDLQWIVQQGTQIQPTVSDVADTMLRDYQRNVIAFGKAHHTLLTEFNEARFNNEALERPRRVYISHMASYPAFWHIRSALAKIAYTIQEQPDLFGGADDLITALSERSLQKLSAYAHIHESMLLIQGYAAAKAKSDPIAGNIAFELTEIIAFEAHEKTHNPAAPLVFGTSAALYHFEINKDELERDANMTNAQTPLRAKDIAYLLEDKSSLHVASKVIHPTAHQIDLTSAVTAESKSKKQPQAQPNEHLKGTIRESAHQSKDLLKTSEEAREITISNTSKKASAKRPSPESIKIFTQEVKKQLIENIEKVAVTLLGQPKRIEKNGIWHWSEGVRLHTRNGVIPRGTFKNYSHNTENIDVFGMIKHNQGFTRTSEAIQYGASLCGITLEGRELERDGAVTRIQSESNMAPKVAHVDDAWKPIFPVPDEMEHVILENRPSLAFMLKTAGKETMRFAYRDENERLLGYVIRLETEEGHKQTLPLTYCENGKGRASWKWKGFGEVTPLYGLDQLARKPNAPVLLVEGEKAADAAQKLLPDMAVLSWVGGSAGVKKVDLTPLCNKTVVMWPDNDTAGAKAAATLAERFSALSEAAGVANTFKVIEIPHEKLPQKWDLADPLPAAITLGDITAHIVHALNGIEKSLVPSKALVVEPETPHALTTEHTSDLKPITFDEINRYAKACSLDFVPNAENMHFILHVANKSIKDLDMWHRVLGKECDNDGLRYQAISAGLYTAWAKNMLHAYAHEKENIIEKSCMIGGFAARVKAAKIAPQKTNESTEGEKLHAQTLPDNHTIIANARKSYKALEDDRQRRLENAPNDLGLCSHIEKEEIIRTMHQCHILTGHDLTEPVVKSLIKTLHQSLNYDHHLQNHTKQRETVCGVIQHTLEQYGKGVAIIEPIHPEEAQRAHQQEQYHLQQAVQRVHAQTRHLEQQREIEQGINRGLER